MKILSLSLKDYIPLAHKNTHSLEYTLTSPYQIIIGSNGCGKSSLLRQLSPLPPSDKLFLSGGFKGVHINHNNESYELRSDFTKGGKHTFIKEGVVLNDHGTQTAQLMLIEEHFGLTPEIFSVLVGDRLFTDMNTNERHFWMMKLSGLNLDLAMKIFNEFKSRTRDAQGYVNQLNKRLANEQSRRIDEQYLNELKTQRVLLDEQYQWFDQFSEKSSINTTLPQIESYVAEHEQLTAQAKQLGVILPAWIKALNFKGPEDLVALAYTLEAKASLTQAQLDTAYEESREIRQVVNQISATGASGLDEIKEAIEVLDKAILDKRRQTNGFEYLQDDVVAARDSMNAVIGDLLTLFSELPNNTERFYSRQTAADTERQLIHFNQELKIHERRRNDLEHDLAHLRSDDKVNCPQCHHSFVAGIVVTEAELETQIKALNEQIATLELSIKSCNEYLKAFNDYAVQLHQINNIFRQHPIHQDFFKKITDYNYTVNPPSYVVELLTSWQADIEASVYIVGLMQEKRVKESALASLSQLNDVKFSHIQNQADFLDKTISDLLESKETIYSQLKEVKAAQAKLDQLAQIVKRQEELIYRIETLGEGELQNYRASFISDVKKQILSESVELDKRIKEYETHNSLLDDIVGSIDAGKHDMEEYKLLTEHMSPKTGLIADVMLGFIKNFVDMMNDIINSVWTYPLYLHPCQNDKEDLDYKFRVSVKSSPYEISDISKLSTAQVDIVNFAFKLIVTESLGLTDYPIYLDELAAQMDDQHRINMMRAIDDLVESRRCSQMFFISHYAAQHGVFVNSEILLLDKANIINVPREYNKHVVMN